MHFGGNSCESDARVKCDSILIKTQLNRVFHDPKHFWEVSNHDQKKNVWKTCDQKPKQRFQNPDFVKNSISNYQIQIHGISNSKGSQGIIIDALER